MLRISLVLTFLACVLTLRAQQQVSFYAEDSLRITADLYLKDTKAPFILLFHQGDASRGEYSEIAIRLMKLDYNCLAVDLRYGDKINYVRNETANAAKAGDFDRSMLGAQKDIRAALKYIRRYNKEKVILLGSSFSASLCLLEAAGNKDIKAVIALSPGEFFRPELVVKEKIGGIAQPIFISATTLEYDFVKEMFSDISPASLHYFQPGRGRGDHGAKMLWKSSESSDQCWLELLLFFKKIRY
ncbi:MAG: dienelactone hydrolase family protein [Bacteroidales bacterium]|nr:dienelactone hydrolase family protein [Bacteroidales bacterium]